MGSAPTHPPLPLHQHAEVRSGHQQHCSVLYYRGHNSTPDTLLSWNLFDGSRHITVLLATGFEPRNRHSGCASSWDLINTQ
jgi:hypothetical protein